MDDKLNKVDYGEDDLMSPYVIFCTQEESFDIWKFVRTFKEDEEGLVQVSSSVAIATGGKHSPFHLLLGQWTKGMWSDLLILFQQKINSKQLVVLLRRSRRM